MKNQNYKQTVIGEIPEDWQVTTLGGTATLNYGKSLPEMSRSEGGVPVYGSSGVTGYHSQALVQNEGYIIGRKGTIGTVHYSPEPFYPIDTTYYVTKDDINCDFKYFYYLLKYLNLNKLNFDSAVPGLNRGVAYRQKYAAPKTISEQQQIASILTSLDDKIELNRKINKTLEEIGKALFKRWFVDFEFPNDDGKPYKSSGGKMVDSELGEIPKGWKIKPLRELVEYYIGGGWGSELQDEDHPIEAAVVRGTDIPAIKTDGYGLLPIRFHKRSNYKARVLTEGDIVFEVSGGSTDQPVGRSCLVLAGLVDQFDNKPICASFCKLLRPVRDFGYLLQPSFELLYSTDEIYKYQEKSTGITNYKFEFFLDDYKFALPSDPSLITQYIMFSRSLNSRMSVLSVESENQKKIRDSLLPRLMSGKLRVTV